MYEKRLKAVPPQLFTTDGTANGKITVADSSLFKVKQEVSVVRTSTQPMLLEIKRIDDINTIYLGPLSQTIDKRQDMSAYTVAAGSNISAIEQKRPSIPSEEVNRAVYEEEPAVALRTILVDSLGNKIDNNNPLPVQVDTTVNIGDVRITANDNDPNLGNVHSSIRISDGTDEVTTSTRSTDEVGLDTNVLNRAFSKPFDEIEVLTKNDDGNPTVIVSRLNTALVQTLTLTYDLDGDFKKMVIT